jgi:hypothetical protein
VNNCHFTELSFVLDKLQVQLKFLSYLKQSYQLCTGPSAFAEVGTLSFLNKAWPRLASKCPGILAKFHSMLTHNQLKDNPGKNQLTPNSPTS